MKNSSVSKEKRLATEMTQKEHGSGKRQKKTPDSFSCHIAILCNLISKFPSVVPYKHRCTSYSFCPGSFLWQLYFFISKKSSGCTGVS